MWLERVEIVAQATLAAVIAAAIAGTIAVFASAWERGDSRAWPFMAEREYEALYRALVIPVEELLEPVSPVRRARI